MASPFSTLPGLFLSTLSLRRATFPLFPAGQYGALFLSTLSLRRATTIVKALDALERFLSTLSLRRATGTRSSRPHPSSDFYPRSPCGERRSDERQRIQDIEISIHALLAESDLSRSVVVFSSSLFLSTLSLRRATVSGPVKIAAHSDFYPRSPCGERLTATPAASPSGHFYPRSPCGERLIERQVHIDAVYISIHALLAESDMRSETA